MSDFGCKITIKIPHSAKNRAEFYDVRWKMYSLPHSWSYVFFDSLSSFKDLHLFTKILTSIEIRGPPLELWSSWTWNRPWATLDLCHDSAKHASMMALAAPSVILLHYMPLRYSLLCLFHFLTVDFRGLQPLVNKQVYSSRIPFCPWPACRQVSCSLPGSTSNHSTWWCGR